MTLDTLIEQENERTFLKRFDEVLLNAETITQDEREDVMSLVTKHQEAHETTASRPVSLAWTRKCLIPNVRINEIVRLQNEIVNKQRNERPEIETVPARRQLAYLYENLAEWANKEAENHNERADWEEMTPKERMIKRLTDYVQGMNADDLSRASWNDQDGVLLSGDDAKLILGAISPDHEYNVIEAFIKHYVSVGSNFYTPSEQGAMEQIAREYADKRFKL